LALEFNINLEIIKIDYASNVALKLQQEADLTVVNWKGLKIKGLLEVAHENARHRTTFSCSTVWLSG
jgi:hypothetical protein